MILVMYDCSKIRIGFSVGLSRPALVVFLLRAAELCWPPPFCCPQSVYAGDKMYLCLYKMSFIVKYNIEKSQKAFCYCGG